MDITYPGTFPFVGTDTTVSPYPLFKATPPASLSVLNGWLDGNNFASSFALEDVHTQPGSIVNAWQASGNSNLDYRPSVFGGYEFDTTSGDSFRMPFLPGESKFYIPGANNTFYLPVESYVAFFWTVYWNAQTVATGQLSYVYFVLNDEIQPGDARFVGQTAAATTAVNNLETNQGYKKARTYHGHYVTPSSAKLAAGWHSAGLAVLADKDVLMTRIHACDIAVLAFKA